jgi:hypothetical protein
MDGKELDEMERIYELPIVETLTHAKGMSQSSRVHSVFREQKQGSIAWSWGKPLFRPDI